MNNLLISGGWFIWPLLVCSILLISIVLERLWFLQRRLVAPKGLLRQAQNLIQEGFFSCPKPTGNCSHLSIG